MKHAVGDRHYEVAIVGAGIAGMATALRLQMAGLRTVVLEAHSKIGGCAGYFRRRGFSFDVGATTLVDFSPDGVSHDILEAIGIENFCAQSEVLPGYVAWLPDRKVTLHREIELWSKERLKQLGASPAHQQFWSLIDHLASIFWKATRKGIKLPIQSPQDIFRNIHAIGLTNLPFARYLTWTMGDALRAHGLREDKPLVGLLSMLIEDTVHSTVDEAPLINAALGVTIRGAGLTRHFGGMRGFWESFLIAYRSAGGEIYFNHQVQGIQGQHGQFHITAQRSDRQQVHITAGQIVNGIPISALEKLAPQIIGKRLQRKIQRDADHLGGAIVVFLGVRDEEVNEQEFTHHQLLQDYDAPLGNGNNMFISVSSQDDVLSAPPHHRAVMISTHCNLDEWNDLSEAEYQHKKCEVGERLIHFAHRVYPCLGERPLVYEVGTPRTYADFALRPQGAVGGVRQTRFNSNQFAVPHNIGIEGFWLVGDSTFPGLGTVAGVLGSRIVTEGVLKNV